MRALLVLVASVALAQQAETLRYTINWPSGLSLGEATCKAESSGGNRIFELSLEAAIPGFSVRDVFRASATQGWCSLKLEKESLHGTRRAREKSTFDATRGMLIRETVGGGKSEQPIPACAKDALTFLFFMRKELAAGRLPASQTVHFGAPYQLRLQYAGTQRVTLGD